MANWGVGLNVCDVVLEELLFVGAGGDNRAKFFDACGGGVTVDLGLLDDEGLCHVFFVVVGLVEAVVCWEFFGSLVDVA